MRSQESERKKIQMVWTYAERKNNDEIIKKIGMK